MTLAKGMIDRSKEYCQWRDIKILICSWNIDASKPKAQDVNGGADRRMFESWLTSMDQEGPPDIISVGFQEIVDLESKKMTASTFCSPAMDVRLQRTVLSSKAYACTHGFLFCPVLD